ncbi:MAG: NAD-dependent epimerase/dehydratase family protein [Acidimicrobiales bacterium]|nr:NAD-dependent epimerase/dehydratase family protein [Acidimicrobiales bacterium]
MASCVVAGAGGFIGGHLVAALVADGVAVRAVDVKPLDVWYQVHPEAENLVVDLSDRDTCRRAVAGTDRVFNLAADMGGIGFIEGNKADCMLSVLINTHLLLAARDAGVERVFYSSSACVYAAEKQVSPEVVPLRERDAYPAMPEDGYGWEKLFAERMCRHFAEDYGIATRVARYHNIYGPHGSYDGGREKAPAAVCRKVAAAVLAGDDTIEIWGDGEQTRSFTYIDDCLTGTQLIAASAVDEPLNLGSSEMVTINQLVDMVEDVAGVKLKRRYRLDAPQGVRGRSSDNTRILDRLGWEPATRLADGIEPTYRWVHDQLAVHHNGHPRSPERVPRDELRQHRPADPAAAQATAARRE